MLICSCNSPHTDHISSMKRSAGWLYFQVSMIMIYRNVPFLKDVFSDCNIVHLSIQKTLFQDQPNYLWFKIPNYVLETFLSCHYGY